jgi:DegV family protein with EDD domain
MPKVVVVTDSCASIPESIIEALNIHWVAYYIHRGEEVLRDLVTIQRKEFLKWMETTKTLPTTASPGPGDYLEQYQALANQGTREIISLHMTSRGSGAYQAACVAQSMAREQMPEVRIEVVDTRNVSLCQGWMVIEAARAAVAGKSIEDILALVQSLIPITQMVQTADTLKYLYMGGRIGKAQALVGSLLNIKPLIGMDNGVIVALGKARSKINAYKMMVEIVERAAGFKGKVKIAYVHAGAFEEVAKIREMVEERLTCVETLVAELSPALAVHSGPGTAGVCFYPLDSA